MFVRRYISKHLDSNCYIAYNDKYTIVVDPTVSYEEIKKDIKGTLLGIFITHGHYDHFYELDSYLKNSDCKIYLHKNAIEKLENGYYNYSRMEGIRLEFILDNRFIIIKEGELLLEKLKVNIYEMPGHSNCSIIINIDDIIFTGDFLFKGSIGRTDLYTGNNTQMILSINRFKDNSLFNKYIDYYIYPGHGDFTTRNDEIKNNPYFN